MTTADRAARSTVPSSKPVGAVLGVLPGLLVLGALGAGTLWSEVMDAGATGTQQRRTTTASAAQSRPAPADATVETVYLVESAAAGERIVWAYHQAAVEATSTGQTWSGLRVTALVIATAGDEALASRLLAHGSTAEDGRRLEVIDLRNWQAPPLGVR